MNNSKKKYNNNNNGALFSFFIMIRLRNLAIFMSRRKTKENVFVKTLKTTTGQNIEQKALTMSPKKLRKKTRYISSAIRKLVAIYEILR